MLYLIPYALNFNDDIRLPEMDAFQTRISLVLSVKLHLSGTNST